MSEEEDPKKRGRRSKAEIYNNILDRLDDIERELKKMKSETEKKDAV